MKTINPDLIGDLVTVTITAGDSVRNVTAVLSGVTHSVVTTQPTPGWLGDHGEQPAEPTVAEQIALYFHGVVNPVIIKGGEDYNILGVRQ